MSPLFSWIYVGGLLALGIWITLVLIVRAAEWEEKEVPETPSADDNYGL